MTAFYNEFDPKAAAWLRELIRCGLIADGVVDERSILDVEPADLAGFTQCHFFAGVGGWSLALRLAGWPDSRPVWTGSPPCQPFSAAGRQLGKDDERHLAPHFASLVAACQPVRLFGEQVASAAVFGKASSRSGKSVEGQAPLEWAWLDDLFERLEAAHYACGASDIPAAGVGAAHIRQRTFFGASRLANSGNSAGQREIARATVGRFSATDGAYSAFNGVADANDAGSQGRVSGRPDQGRAGQPGHGGRGGATGGMADADGGNASAEREQSGGQHRQQPQDGGVGGLADADAGGEGVVGNGGVRLGGGGPRDARAGHWRGGSNGGLADALHAGRPEWRPLAGDGSVAGGSEFGGRPDAPDLGWPAADWLFCRDGKWRPVEPRTFPLAHGVSARVGRLRGYGNAIVPQAAAEFIKAFDAASAECFRLNDLSTMTTDEGVFG